MVISGNGSYKNRDRTLVLQFLGSKDKQTWVQILSLPFPFGKYFPGGSEVKVSACNAEDPGSIPELRRSPGEGNGNPLQYSFLENPMEGGAWQATVHRVAKSRTGLNYFTFTFFPHYFSQTRACHWHSLCEDGHSFSLSSVRNDNLRHRNLNKQMCCEKPQRIRSLGLSSNPFHIYTKGVLTSKLNENVEALNIYLLFIFTIN